MKMTGEYKGEGIEVVFYAHGCKCDYGVEGSPVWYEPDRIYNLDVYILCVSVEYQSLPKPLQKAIMDLAHDPTIEWELVE